MKLNRELPNILLALIPLIYLGMIYNSLPAVVPTHWGLHGTPDDWSAKWTLWLIGADLPLFVYLIFVIVPAVDPKRRLTVTGKYNVIKFVTILFISSISCFLIYMVQHPQAHLDKFLFALVGLFLAILGNFFPTLKPNYFIGIRSPWTLENETVWRKTHVLGGRLWVIGGILLVALTFVLPQETFVPYVALPLILIMAFVPIIYSYMMWRGIKNKK